MLPVPAPLPDCIVRVGVLMLPPVCKIAAVTLPMLAPAFSETLVRPVRFCATVIVPPKAVVLSENALPDD